jgi:hypothetical protein
MGKTKREFESRVPPQKSTQTKSEMCGGYPELISPIYKRPLKSLECNIELSIDYEGINDHSIS